MREWTDCVVDFGSLATEAAERITPEAAEACRQKAQGIFFFPFLLCGENRKRPRCSVSGGRNHEVSSPRFIPQRDIFSVTLETR